jgi:hypothetical protein
MRADLVPEAKARGWVIPEWMWVAVLFGVVTLAWCAHYDRWSIGAWRTPVVYGGDAWGTLAGAKATATGECPPIVTKHPASLGAPFRANWNDYPNVEEAILAWSGFLSWIFGPFAGANLALLSGHLFAAGAFYWVCRRLRYSSLFSVVGAILFALSRYSFARGLPHLTLAFYWHVPLGLLVAWMCVTKDAILTTPKRLWFCVAVAIFHAVQSPYFTWMFAQFLGAATLICIIRRSGWRRIAAPVVLAAITGTTFLLMNADTFYYKMRNGPNPAAVVRSFDALERYALKPIELFLPDVHSWAAFAGWTQRAYYQQTLFLGETGAPYLGVIGIFALGLLASSVLKGFPGRQGPDSPSHFWGTVYVAAYAVVGGANIALGLVGIVLFRCSNRYSIVILAILLLFLVKRLTLYSEKWSSPRALLLAAGMVALGLWDQVPPRDPWWDVANVKAMVAEDGKLVSTMEAKLPPSAMVFQLPVMDFPEVPPLLGVSDYELFRPYFYSHKLRFSYGSDKGRYRERWQKEAESLGAPGLVKLLENYGFSALLINRKGYQDRARSLLADLQSMGRSTVVAESSDSICIELRPAARPVLPPEFDGNWYAVEGDANNNWRWSLGNATIVLHNPGPDDKIVHVTSGFATSTPRFLQVFVGARKIYDAFLSPSQTEASLNVTITLRPGKTQLQFTTDVPADSPGHGDARKLAYNITNFNIVSE